MKETKKVVETKMSNKELNEWGDNLVKEINDTGDVLSKMGKDIMKFAQSKIPGATHIIISEDNVEVLESELGVNFALWRDDDERN